MCAKEQKKKSTKTTLLQYKFVSCLQVSNTRPSAPERCALSKPITVLQSEDDDHHKDKLNLHGAKFDVLELHCNHCILHSNRSAPKRDAREVAAHDAREVAAHSDSLGVHHSDSLGLRGSDSDSLDLHRVDLSLGLHDGEESWQEGA